jgi:hypothetical protein
LLSVTGAFTEFKRSLIRERQREGTSMLEDEGMAAMGEPRCSEFSGPLEQMFGFHCPQSFRLGERLAKTGTEFVRQ